MSDEDKPRKKSRSYPGKKVKNIKRSQFKRVKPVTKTIGKPLPKNHFSRYSNIEKILRKIKEDAIDYDVCVEDGVGVHHGYLLNSISFQLPGDIPRVVKVYTRGIGDHYFIDKDHEDYYGNKPQAFFMKLVLPWKFFGPESRNSTIFIHDRKGTFTGTCDRRDVKHRPRKVDKEYLSLLSYFAEEGLLGSGISEEKIEVDENGIMIPITQGERLLWGDKSVIKDDQRFLNYFGLILLFKEMITSGWTYETNYDYSVNDMYDRTELIFRKGNKNRIFTFIVLNERYDEQGFRLHRDIYAKFNICEHGEGWGSRHYTVTGAWGSCIAKGNNNRSLPEGVFRIVYNKHFNRDDQGYGLLRTLLTKMGVRGLHFYREKTPPKPITLKDFPQLPQFRSIYGWL